jgi:hypothetical protein
MNIGTREYPAIDSTTTPFLLWTETTVSADGAALACPQCAGPNLHLDTVQLAVPADNANYAPTVGLSINPDTGAALADHEARRLHAGRNRGPMLAIAYWCENGCLGHLELRQHKGILYASHHTDDHRQHPAEQPDPQPVPAAGDEPAF